MKKRLLTSRHSGLAILAGALTFMGNASAVTIFSEGFEGGADAGNIFGVPTYAYAENYTQPNLLTPAGGLNYMHGGDGVTGSASTNTFPATGSPFSIVTGGLTNGQIDGGLVVYNFSAQFSTYQAQNDFGEVEITFLDGASAPIGSPLRIGSSALVTALDGGAGSRAWGSDQLSGTVPAGARSVSLTAFETKTAGGTVIDGYMDNIVLDLTAVPEPSVSLSALLAGSLLAGRRRRREAR